MQSVYEVAMRSIPGTRAQQQDYAFYQAGPDRVFAVVCDGMGGMDEGFTASAVATEKIKEQYCCKNPAESYSSFFMRSVEIIDECVYSLKNTQGERLNAGTTIVAAVIEDDRLYWLSVGDSRLYLLRENEIVQVTRDHNYFLSLNQLAQENRIDRREYEYEAARGEALISYIGMGGVQIADINEIPFRLMHGDTVLLTSDGLSKALPDWEILRILSGSDVASALDSLIDRSVEYSAAFQDNTTCIAIRFCEEQS